MSPVPVGVRTLLKAGIPIRALLKTYGITQRTIVEASGVSAPHVSMILSSEQGRRRCGVATTRKVYRAVAAALEVDVREIPEARPYLEGDF